VSDPSETAVKTLFAHSRNTCFFARCEENLTKPGWKQVAGEVAHIKGEHDGSARYDIDQPDAERQGYDNLMLLCPKHHKLVDRQEPDNYPDAAVRDWCTQEEALRFARLAIQYWRGQTAPGLHVTSARYGAEGTLADVTGIVAARVTGDQLNLRVTNQTMGGDPVVNIVKQLEIQYIYNGDARILIVPEDQDAVLPSDDTGTT
jgi:hypothetical protein